MLRQILLIVLPLMLPTLVYMAYVLVVRGKGAESGATTAPWLAGAPWAGLLVGGVALAGVSLVTLALTSGHPKTETYHPAHLTDGHVVRGETTPSSPTPGR
ncbi:hypothetical protein N825_31335 [Skermanella stibiiresistens SB22]|uniref:Uncharacterized protein n=1 Tax=Skermanella stibiiresistens SB22 TaxID=1385369 RepID=W9H554_9PROT|nr:DUF6111 family protein [Skermanella stibiiresistens]EWY41154.1 hypothetical protein N825_31335 [Skermanella stibiiresistens SB22]